MARLLLQLGADVNAVDADGRRRSSTLHAATAVTCSASSSRPCGRRREARGNTALIEASANGHDELAGVLIEYGSDIGHVNHEESAPTPPAFQIAKCRSRRRSSSGLQTRSRQRRTASWPN